MVTTWKDHAEIEQEKYIEYFRVTKSIFNDLYDGVKERIEKKDTNWRPAIHPRKRFAITLYYLARGCTFDVVASVFGVGDSTVPGIVRDCISALRDTIVADNIRFPKGDDLLRTMGAMEQLIGLPQCAGAIDGSFIYILADDNGYHFHFAQEILGKVKDIHLTNDLNPKLT